MVWTSLCMKEEGRRELQEAQDTPGVKMQPQIKKERTVGCSYLLYWFKTIIMCQTLYQENTSGML